MTRPDPKDDDLVRLYRQASAQDPRRPTPRVDAAIRAHARMVASAGKAELPAAEQDKPVAAPANSPHGLRAMLASVAVIGLMGLLFLQFDRGTPQEKNLAQGTPQPAETGPARLTPPPEAERSGAHVAADAVPTPASRVRIAPLPVPATSMAKAEARAPEPATTGQTREASVGSGAARSPLTSALPAPSVRRDAAMPPASLASVGDTALHALARAGQIATLDALLATGVPIDARDARGRTPLMEAAARGHVDMVGRLLAGGANRQLRDRDGQTAAQLARAAGHGPLADLIETGS